MLVKDGAIQVQYDGGVKGRQYRYSILLIYLGALKRNRLD